MERWFQASSSTCGTRDNGSRPPVVPIGHGEVSGKIFGLGRVGVSVGGGKGKGREGCDMGRSGSWGLESQRGK